MALSPEHAQRRLSRMRATAPWAVVFGALLMFLGGSYGIWGARQLAVGEKGAWQGAFDRPIVRVGMVFLEHIEPLKQRPVTTPLEEQLRDELVVRTEWLAAGVVILFRFMLASMLLTGGMAVLSSGLTRKEVFMLMDRVSRENAHAG